MNKKINAVVNIGVFQLAKEDGLTAEYYSEIVPIANIIPFNKTIPQDEFVVTVRIVKEMTKSHIIKKFFRIEKKNKSGEIIRQTNTTNYTKSLGIAIRFAYEEESEA